MSQLSFEDDFWYAAKFQAIKFAASEGGERHVFAISRIALNDRYRTPDTKEDAIKNFENHIEEIQLVATRVYEAGLRSVEHGHFFIDSSLCKEFGL